MRIREQRASRVMRKAGRAMEQPSGGRQAGGLIRGYDSLPAGAILGLRWGGRALGRTTVPERLDIPLVPRVPCRAQPSNKLRSRRGRVAFLAAVRRQVV